jgi:predicted ATPase
VNTGSRRSALRKMTNMDTDPFVVISGCSSRGKSTLVTELGRRGYVTVEPGRRIVNEEMLGNGPALP